MWYYGSSSSLLLSFVFVLLVLSLLARSVVYGLYDESDHDYVNISKLKSANEIIESDSIWMVQVYNPEQKESKELAPIYKALATIMRGVFPFGVIDVTGGDDSVAIAKGLKIKSKKTPAVYIIGGDMNNRSTPVSVTSSPGELPTIQQLTETLMREVSKNIDQRFRDAGFMTADSNNKANNNQKQDSNKKKNKKTKSNVIQLNGSNFDELVYQNPAVVAVAFTAPWCGHCKNLLPEWEEAADKLMNSGAVLGWIDATTEPELAQQYNVKGYPTIKIFPGGINKTIKDAVDYPSERKASSIVQYMIQMVDQTGIPPPLPQLINQDIMNEVCGGHNRICILAALPHILDSGASGRDKYIETLQTVAKQFRGSAFTFAWFEYNTQLALENTLELTFGAPAIVALSMEKKAYAVYRSSYKPKGISGFLNSITTGKQSVIPLPPNTPTDLATLVVPIDPWDGKDGQPIEDEIPLSEIMGDEL